MNINELPEEILVRILSFLPRSDRLVSALTCRRWAQTVDRAPSLLRDIWLVIREHRMEEARTVFANSQRQHENLRLERVRSLEFNAAFWARVGRRLNKLELIDSLLSLEVLLSILQACSNLETLKICNFDSDKWSELAPGMNLESIRNSMRNLRHLHLDFSVDAETLERLFILMPNVTSIALSQSPNGSDFLARLPGILGASRRITMLGLVHGSSNDHAQLVRICSASLRTLNYHGRKPIVFDELRNCSMLRDLHFYCNNPQAIGLQNILRSVPELESLSIRTHECRENFRREDLMPIFNLSKLRKLDLDVRLVDDDYPCVSRGIVGGLSRMVSLESLTLGEKWLGVVDSSRFRLLASTPNLRELIMRNVDWDSEFFGVLLFGLGKLRTLMILGGRCRHQYSELERSIPLAKDCQGEQKSSFLEVLTIEDIPLTDAVLGQITAHHGRLRIVNLSGEDEDRRRWACEDITDAGLVTLFQHEPFLEELTIYGAYNLEGTFLEGLGELCRRLRSLTVPFHNWISNQAVEEFKLRRPRVKCYFGGSQE